MAYEAENSNYVTLDGTSSTTPTEGNKYLESSIDCISHPANYSFFRSSFPAEATYIMSPTASVPLHKINLESVNSATATLVSRRLLTLRCEFCSL